MNSKKSKWSLEWIALILSIIVPTINGLYNLKLNNDAKDPVVNFYRKENTEILFEIRNDKVQMDYCNFYFPSYGDTYYVYKESLIADADTVIQVVRKTKSPIVTTYLTPYTMIINTKVFKYFSKFASCNNIADNKEISIPFVIDLTYHYLDIRMHAVYLAHFVLFKKNEDVIINDWGFDNIRIERINETDLGMRMIDTTSTEYKYISSWNYINN